MRTISRKHIDSSLKAGALYFVVFLLFLMTILLSSYILFVHYKNQLIIRQVGISQIEQNIQSALKLYCVKPNILNESNSVEKTIFNEIPSKVTITQNYWGVYQLLRFKGKYKEIEQTKFALLGSKYGSIKPTALYVTDKERYISICGNSQVRGYCYLPKLGMRTARIEGRLFNGYMENRSGYILQSSKDMPKPPESLISSCMSYFNLSSGVTKRSELLIGGKKVFNSFADTTIIFTSSNSYWNIENTSISGNIELFSDKEIYINLTANLQNIIVVGRKVVLKNGFIGQIQVFASDTIIVEDNVRLLYPSNLTVIDCKSNQKLIYIGKKCEVQGAVWIWNPVNDNNISPLIRIEQGTVVKGQIYSPGRIQLKGDVWGTLYTDLFFLSTPNVYYENYVYNSIIDGEKLPSNFACIPFIFDYKEMQFIDWLF